MPYVKMTQREQIDDTPIGVYLATDKGELTYALYRLCLNYLPDGYRYDDLGDVIAALEGAKLEFYREVISEYEDHKKVENGPIVR